VGIELIYKIQKQTRNSEETFSLVSFFCQKGTEDTMRIINSESFSRLEHIQKSEVISLITKLIFSVSEVGKNFSGIEKLQEQEKNVLKAKEKISKQKELLSKVSLLKSSLSKKILLLKDENSSSKSKILTRMRVEE